MQETLLRGVRRGLARQKFVDCVETSLAVVRVGDFQKRLAEHFCPRIAEDLAKAVVHQPKLPGEVGLSDADRCLKKSGAEPFLAVLQRQFRLPPFGCEANMGGDGLRDLEFFRPKLVRLVVIQHELADHSAISQQRNEGNGSNPFLHQRRPQAGKRWVHEDVRNGDGPRVGSASPPGRVACHRRPVFVRQAGPGFEPDHVIGVEDQNAGVVGAHGARQALHRRPIDLGGLMSEVDRLAQGRTAPASVPACVAVRERRAFAP